MLIPCLHFCGDCKEAIALYEKAFNTKAETLITNNEYSPGEYPDNEIAHAVMNICGQKVFLNDRFGNKNKTMDCAVRLLVMFETAEELLACYEFFKAECIIVDQFEELPYSKLSGLFIDKYGVQWGFMVAQQKSADSKCLLDMPDYHNNLGSLNLRTASLRLK